MRWTDNRLLIDWERVDDAVAELRERLDELYRARHRSEQGLVLDRGPRPGRRATCDPNVGSQWQREGRVYSDEAEPRAWIDRVLDDEFPLSMFYETLKKKLAEELVPRSRRGRGGSGPRFW